MVAIKAPNDGLSDAAPHLQAALDEHRLVTVPAGHYLIGKTLRLPSGTQLKIDDGAVLHLATGAATTSGDYLLTNADHRLGNTDISISGGLWNGNNAGNPRPPGLFDQGYTGALFHFEAVRNLRLGNLILTNAEAYYCRLTAVTQFHIEGIRFDDSIIRPNNDGIHLGGDCEDGLIRNLVGLRPGVTGDDMVALNADDASQRTEVRGMRNGPIRRITIQHVRAQGCHSFVRLLSVHSPIEDISIEDLAGTCEVAAINADAARGCRVPLFDEAQPPFPDGVGWLNRIRIRQIHAAKSTANGIPLLRLETRLSDFQIEDFHRDLAHDADPSAPLLRLRHVGGQGIDMEGQHHQVALGESLIFDQPTLRHFRATRR